MDATPEKDVTCEAGCARQTVSVKKKKSNCIFWLTDFGCLGKVLMELNVEVKIILCRCFAQLA